MHVSCRRFGGRMMRTIIKVGPLSARENARGKLKSGAAWPARSRGGKSLRCDGKPLNRGAEVGTVPGVCLGGCAMEVHQRAG